MDNRLRDRAAIYCVIFVWGMSTNGDGCNTGAMEVLVLVLVLVLEPLARQRCVASLRMWRFWALEGGCCRAIEAVRVGVVGMARCDY